MNMFSFPFFKDKYYTAVSYTGTLSTYVSKRLHLHTPKMCCKAVICMHFLDGALLNIHADVE